MGALITGPWNTKNFEESLLHPIDSESEYLVIDTETTGLFSRDRIVEIGAIAFKGTEILEEWSTLINPSRDVGPTNIHGITPSMVSLAPSFEEVTNDLARLMNGRILVCHNASFDVRMLAQELNRTNIQGSFGKAFCTMVAARRLLPPGLDKLSDACESLGINVTDAHSALGDARMTQKLFLLLMEDEQSVSRATINYDNRINPSPSLPRKIFSKNSDDSLERIRAFTKKVPFPTSDESEIAYLLLLNMAMDDLIISVAEKSELDSWATNLGISESGLQRLHENYLESFIQTALRDNVITLSEKTIIDKVANALGLTAVIPASASKISSIGNNLAVGSKVCFTGVATTMSGTTIPRTELEFMAAKVGLHPVNSVTKKGCDFLIAADDSTMSGKAKKAREWGIEVMSVDKFISFCTFG